ncbi:MAG: hypothetical protein WCI87_07700 [Euryarchaeota archaeon]
MPYVNREKQRTYQKVWKRDKRAKAAAEKAGANAKPISDRIAAIEKELAMLKAEVQPAGLTLNILEDSEPLQNEREERIKRFKARLYASNNNKSIATQEAEAAALQAEFNAIVQEGPDFVDKVDLLRNLSARKDRINALRETEAAIEKDIVDLSKGGVVRRSKEARISGDQRQARIWLNSPDPQERRKGEGLLKACVENLGGIEVTLGKKKAELAALRGD